MKCGVCGGDGVAHDVRDLTYTYKGESTVVRAVEGDYCPDCDEVVLSGLQAQAYSDAITAFTKKVNAGFVDPAFIAEVRKKLRLDQREAGDLFGGGANAFSRYENGLARPSVALVKLLRMLDKHPERLVEFKDVA